MAQGEKGTWAARRPCSAGKAEGPVPVPDGLGRGPGPCGQPAPPALSLEAVSTQAHPYLHLGLARAGGMGFIGQFLQRNRLGSLNSLEFLKYRH